MKLAILAVEISTPENFFQPQHRNVEFVPQFTKSYGLPLVSARSQAIWQLSPILAALEIANVFRGSDFYN